MGAAGVVLAGAGVVAAGAGAAGLVVAAGVVVVVVEGLSPDWQAPKVTVKPSNRAKLTTFLFIHSSS